jgi:hypothetical protein
MNREQWKMKQHDALRNQAGTSEAPKTAEPPDVPALPEATIVVARGINAHSRDQAMAPQKKVCDRES